MPIFDNKWLNPIAIGLDAQKLDVSYILSLIAQRGLAHSFTGRKSAGRISALGLPLGKKEININHDFPGALTKSTETTLVMTKISEPPVSRNRDSSANSFVVVNNYGSGPKNVNSSSGSQYNNTGLGHQYFAGTQIFGKNKISFELETI
jgi:hypothetical protein